jgi:hypothetical protein
MDWYAIYGRSLVKLDRTNLQPNPRHADDGDEKVQSESDKEDSKDNKNSKRQKEAPKEKEQECNS